MCPIGRIHLFTSMFAWVYCPWIGQGLAIVSSDLIWNRTLYLKLMGFATALPILRAPAGEGLICELIGIGITYDSELLGAY